MAPFGVVGPLPGRLFGFAVAASLLDLPAGMRLITLHLQVSPASFASLQQLLPLIAPANPAAGPPLLTAFQAQATGPGGWLPLETPQPVRLNPADHTIAWTFRLDHSQPAVVAYDPVLHGGQLPTTAPVLQLMSSSPVLPHEAAFLAALEPVAWRLHVAVEQSETLELSNQNGLLVASCPFQPFGPMALPGAYLELAVPGLGSTPAKTTAFALVLHWQNLPANGFAAYFGGYEAAFPNNGFQLKLWGSWGEAGENWGLLSEQPQQLFPTAASGELAGSVTQLRLEWPPARATLGLPSSSLRLKIELTAPTQGFGFLLYPAALANALAYNADHAASPRLQPRQPFVPLLKAVTVSYEAEEFGDVAWELPPNQSTGLYRLVSPAGLELVRTDLGNELKVQG